MSDFSFLQLAFDYELTDNFYVQLRFVILPDTDIFDLSNSKHAVYHLSEDDVLAIKEFTFCGCDEELEQISI